MNRFAKEMSNQAIVFLLFGMGPVKILNISGFLKLKNLMQTYQEGIVEYEQEFTKMRKRLRRISTFVFFNFIFWALAVFLLRDYF